MSGQVTDRHEFYIVDPKNESIATSTVYFRHGVYWLTNVWVHHEHRKKGLATQVINAVIEKYGQYPIYLNVDAYTDQPRSNDELFNYYARFGFVRSTDPGVMKRDLAGKE